MTICLGRSSTPLIASEALRTRFKMTCWSCTRSPVTRRGVILELGPEDDPAALQVSRQQRNHLPDGVIQIQDLGGDGLVAEERPQTRDNVGGPFAIADRPTSSLERATDVGRIGREQPYTGAGVGDDARQRLIDLVRNRGGQCSKTDDPGDLCELRPRHGRAPDPTDGACVTSCIAPKHSRRSSGCARTFPYVRVYLILPSGISSRKSHSSAPAAPRALVDRTRTTRARPRDGRARRYARAS